jgi:hypothetical protein
LVYGIDSSECPNHKYASRINENAARSGSKDSAGIDSFLFHESRGASLPPVLIGYAERRVDRTDVKNIIEIHQALRTGLNLERELLGKIANIEFLMERYFSAKVEVETDEKRKKVFQERIARLIEEDND